MKALTFRDARVRRVRVGGVRRGAELALAVLLVLAAVAVVPRKGEGEVKPDPPAEKRVPLNET